ncbi:MAG: rRNA maturation RNase YbeY [Gammaproteobacteria bacterium]
MNNTIEIQTATSLHELPSTEQFQQWVDAALGDYPSDTEVVIRIVDEAESALLNEQYRGKQGPTNILSFPFEVPAGIPSNLLGDLVVCAPVVEREARTGGKTPSDHWAHIVVHGILHLLGYDHIDDADAEIMEGREIDVLDQLNISNPYNEA